jgi:Dyp-type peroxidase family
MATKCLNLSNIQGNIIGGFNKDFQDFLFLKFRSSDSGRGWIREIMDPKYPAGVADSTCQNILTFKTQFRALRDEGINPETVITSAWTNLAVSFSGFKALGFSMKSLVKFPIAFREGMRARSNKIGDIGLSDPAHWVAPYKSGEIHALLIVAADTESQLNNRVNAITDSDCFKTGVLLLARENGRARDDEPSHEHFGFKDGISQPGIRGVTIQLDPIGNPDQGSPGQELLWPGEFVLGYPTQKPKHKPGVQGPNADPGPLSKSGPAWTVDGSYLVFRRLAQDVEGFRKNLNSLASASGLSEDLIGAKLFGRYKSGCPLMPRQFQRNITMPPLFDPGKTNAALHESPMLNNNFRFGDDPTGKICPLGSHIRKANPRDEIISEIREDSPSEIQTHRILRRGIPYGASYGALHGGNADDPRGLLFVCYQKDIENQFEFVLTRWLNNCEFPPQSKNQPAGQDPVVSQTRLGPFQLDPDKPSINIQHFIKLTGGEYFFAPSLGTLRKIGAGQI